MSNVPQILSRAQGGDLRAAEELLPLVYEELRKLAAAQMANEAVDHTLQPTALVHEAWLRLTGQPAKEWNDRVHFFRAAAEAMRRILVDRARERLTRKRGGDAHHTELSESKLGSLGSTDDQMIEIDAALEELARREPISAELVKLRYFVGMNMADAAKSLNIPLRTAERIWTFARTWLRREIDERRR